ncbi:MAG: sigma-54-dependent Fis family transcriptional regulator [Deltaproteobacteria bacterium]|nr:sigma-54-dependent Fis family transcriptional regulator [Deltaproteobacteria bacterium]
MGLAQMNAPWDESGRAAFPFVALADSMVAVREALKVAATADVCLVVCGETGTGRLHAARYLHSLGPRPEAPFVRLSARTPTSLERLADRDLVAEATGGTLVLEGVDEASLELQSYLVGWIETWATGDGDPEGSVRVVATTSRDLLGLVASGAFRKDLHYLLDVFPLVLPPLCQRAEEIPSYLEHFHRHLAPDRLVPPVPEEFLAQAFAHAWPGNLRELENLVAASVAQTGGESWALPRLLPREGSLLEFPSFQQAKREFESSYVRRVLLLTEGNVSRAAEIAGKARKDFYALLSRNRIEPQEYRR